MSLDSSIYLARTEPLTEMSTRDLHGAKRGRLVGLTTLHHLLADCLEVSHSFGLHDPLQGWIYLPVRITYMEERHCLEASG
jgi:hypothetical protein